MNDATPKPVTCQHCGGEMHKATMAEKNAGQQVLGVGVFLAGLYLFLSWGPLGMIAGIILMLGACQLGYHKRKVWQCEDCSTWVNRAD